MSTAGKVLVVLIALASLVWMLLLSGVDQLNRNGNKALLDLNEKIVKLDEDIKTAQYQISRLKDETTLAQEKTDRDLAVIRSRQADVERVSSNIREILERVKYQVATLDQTVKDSQRTAQERASEKTREQAALNQSLAEVETLKGQNDELMKRLTSLREEFKSTLRTNSQSLGRAVR